MDYNNVLTELITTYERWNFLTLCYVYYFFCHANGKAKDANGKLKKVLCYR
jgi:hypothetical protein